MCLNFEGLVVTWGKLGMMSVTDGSLSIQVPHVEFTGQCDVDQQRISSVLVLLANFDAIVGEGSHALIMPSPLLELRSYREYNIQLKAVLGHTTPDMETF